MKYIDADKLIAELRKHLIPTVVDRDYDEWEKGKDAGLLQAIGIVESLQREQQKADLEKELREYFKDWKFDDELDIMVKPNNYSASFTDLKEIASNFWNKGYNARKEE